ncbi:OmpA family protein [Sphingomonas sp. 1P06PA]|uniref:OmpA family protein n=1 Tax=Sphingomonas sp. 1P06PA TaxID=554121 RepID=UPI0039A55226
MRSIVLASVAIIGLTASAAASAQTAPSRSAEDIVCELTGDCGQTAAPDASQQLDVPKEAAFSFAKPGLKAAARPAPAPAARVAASAARPGAAAASRIATANRTGAVAGRAAVAAAPATGIDMRITFGSGSAEMTPQGKAEAAQFAKALALPALASKRFVVEGHTDGVGNRDANLRLSQARAELVADYLRSLGIDGGRLEAKGYGPDKPLPGRGVMAPANRRVQFVPLS